MAGPALPPLVSGAWLAGNLDRVRVVDVRWYLDRSRSGRAAYRGGHIPGAVWLDVDTDLSEPASASGGRHPLASPRRFASALGRAGIAAGTPVVAYDDASGSTAGRLWWMLHALGEPAAVLDGGIDAWPGGLTAEVPSFPAVSRVAVPWPAQRFVGAGEVAATVARTAGTAPRPVFDARAAERFSRGDPEVDPRPGHIPGALSAPWAGNVDESGRFLPPARLRDRFAAA
ncbi:MAG: sulfurtransferase, partial [Jatrophihabitans sp.]